ncbi:hypothetical protein F2S88_08360 [Pseudomonas syringae pv. actinidiae]|nr:hypothetical protein [Pseudomonas syringae pv. actinidiae]
MRLFREVEIAIILANAWFEDFDHQRLNSQVTDAQIDALLQRFEGQLAAAPTPGVSSDDVVAAVGLPGAPLRQRHAPAERPLLALRGQTGAALVSARTCSVVRTAVGRYRQNDRNLRTTRLCPAPSGSGRDSFCADQRAGHRA